MNWLKLNRKRITYFIANNPTVKAKLYDSGVKTVLCQWDTSVLTVVTQKAGGTVPFSMEIWGKVEPSLFRRSGNH